MTAGDDVIDAALLESFPASAPRASSREVSVSAAPGEMLLGEQDHRNVWLTLRFIARSRAGLVGRDR
jgi:hypothetical protein